MPSGMTPSATSNPIATCLSYPYLQPQRHNPNSQAQSPDGDGGL